MATSSTPAHLLPLSYQLNPLSALTPSQIALASFHPDAPDNDPLFAQRLYLLWSKKRERLRNLVLSGEITEAALGDEEKLLLSNLTFDLPGPAEIERLTSQQLMLVQFHVNSTDELKMKAYEVWNKRRERDWPKVVTGGGRALSRAGTAEPRPVEGGSSPLVKMVIHPDRAAVAQVGAGARREGSLPLPPRAKEERVDRVVKERRSSGDSPTISQSGPELAATSPPPNKPTQSDTPPPATLAVASNSTSRRPVEPNPPAASTSTYTPSSPPASRPRRPLPPQSYPGTLQRPPSPPLPDIALPPFPSNESEQIPIDFAARHLYSLDLTNLPDHVTLASLPSFLFPTVTTPHITISALLLFKIQSGEDRRYGFIAFPTFEQRTIAQQLLVTRRVGRGWDTLVRFEDAEKVKWQWGDLRRDEGERARIWRAYCSEALGWGREKQDPPQDPPQDEGKGKEKEKEQGDSFIPRSLLTQENLFPLRLELDPATASPTLFTPATLDGSPLPHAFDGLFSGVLAVKLVRSPLPQSQPNPNVNRRGQPSQPPRNRWNIEVRIILDSHKEREDAISEFNGRGEWKRKGVTAFVPNVVESREWEWEWSDCTVDWRDQLARKLETTGEVPGEKQQNVGAAALAPQHEEPRTQSSVAPVNLNNASRSKDALPAAASPPQVPVPTFTTPTSTPAFLPTQDTAGRLLPKPWLRRLSGSTGDYYYVHEPTGNSQWSSPCDAGEREDELIVTPMETDLSTPSTDPIRSELGAPSRVAAQHLPIPSPASPSAASSSTPVAASSPNRPLTISIPIQRDKERQPGARTPSVSTPQLPPPATSSSGAPSLLPSTNGSIRTQPPPSASPHVPTIFDLPPPLTTPKPPLHIRLSSGIPPIGSAPNAAPTPQPHSILERVHTRPQIPSGPSHPTPQPRYAQGVPTPTINLPNPVGTKKQRKAALRLSPDPNFDSTDGGASTSISLADRVTSPRGNQFAYSTATAQRDVGRARGGGASGGAGIRKGGGVNGNGNGNGNGNVAGRGRGDNGVNPGVGGGRQESNKRTFDGAAGGGSGTPGGNAPLAKKARGGNGMGAGNNGGLLGRIG